MSKLFYTAFGTLKYIDNFANFNEQIKRILNATSITYGQSLKDSKISNNKNIVNGKIIDGDFNWKDPLFKPRAGTYIYDISFTPFNLEYNFQLQAKIEVKKFTPNIKDSSASEITYSEPLEKSIISNKNNLVPGKYTWYDPTFIPSKEGINKYNFKFTPDDIYNYKVVYGKLSIQFI